jgi:hypothetical protein
LQPLARSKDVGESRFSMDAEGEDAARDANYRFGGLERGCIGIPVFLEQFRRRCRPIEFMRVRFMPARLDFGKLFLALQKLINWIKR